MSNLQASLWWTFLVVTSSERFTVKQTSHFYFLGGKSTFLTGSKVWSLFPPTATINNQESSGLCGCEGSFQTAWEAKPREKVSKVCSFLTEFEIYICCIHIYICKDSVDTVFYRLVKQSCFIVSIIVHCQKKQDMTTWKRGNRQS